ncbi:BlaI/MecI/CopY family transcriptional regulator [Gimesia panareensis]|uniref:BlaI/MecI/CopY family transcriptional regulator n=1 Tax=Gimesia panareensis TaxID=2527978 RepID=UPI001188DA33|nr:BlaI/MecI/CopY family transcriptional regulator [Gimesia panareensis]QDU49587.1 Transcriptional regulator BlaI [Gimesia panareensis]
MARHRQATPTEVEMEILQVLWENQPSTVREVVDVLNQSRPRAYTSILSMLNVMYDKGLVEREIQGRAHMYRARKSRESTLGGVIKDLLGRAFQGSTSSLITQILEQSKPSADELEEIRKTIEDWQDEETAE